MGSITVEKDNYDEAARKITDAASKNKIEFTNDKDIQEAYKKFQDKYSPIVLKNLPDEEVLDTIFLHDGDNDNLCHALEFDKEYNLAGLIGGGSSYKFRLFKSNNQWKYGSSPKNGEVITESEALNKGKSIRDALVECCEIIENSSLETSNDYVNLEKDLNEVLKNVNIKASHVWIHKYFHMIFPDKFLNYHGQNWRKYLLNSLNMDSNYSYYFNDYQMMEIFKRTNLNVVNFFNAFVSEYGMPNEKLEDSENPQIWLLSAGENARLWNEFKEKNIIAIGWGDLGDLRQFKNKDEMERSLNKLYPIDKRQTNNLKALEDFSTNMQIGDIVYIKKGNNTILAKGRITSDYKFSKELPIDYYNIREVEWENINSVVLDKKLVTKTLTNITPYKELCETIENSINGIKKEDSHLNFYSQENFLNEVLFSKENYNTLADLLQRKQNIILQGPPGVGKTFISKKLAYSLMGEINEDRIEFIQFHQSYSYEDFIQGYRPTKDGFELKDGVFYEFCKKAQEDPENSYYFFIDEINRGNISKIFGELLMLIEADKRGSTNAINLTYSDEKFYVPENVYIIGMMNTADRSLAILDYALRRRFVFYDVNPLFDQEDLLKPKLMENGASDNLASQILQKLSNLNDKIANDEDLGEGFKIGHSYFLDSQNLDLKTYQSIINYEIAPLLREYWFDDSETVDFEIEKLLDVND